MVHPEGDPGWFPVLALVSSVLAWPEVYVNENWKVFGEVNLRVVSAFGANETVFLFACFSWIISNRTLPFARAEAPSTQTDSAVLS